MAIVRNPYESEVVEYLLSELRPNFYVKREVWGEHIAGRRKRIDMIIFPRQEMLDRGFPRIPVGIEIKVKDLDDGNKKQVVELYHQAILYRHTRFELKTGREFLPLILIYPPVENYMKNTLGVCGDGKGWNGENARGLGYFSTRLSGKMFIGELFLRRDLQGDLFRIYLCGTEYFKMAADGSCKRWDSHWGFEKYEEEKEKLLRAGLSPERYDREIMKLTELLGI